jgi:hypothetical protein
MLTISGAVSKLHIGCLRGREDVVCPARCALYQHLVPAGDQHHRLLHCTVFLTRSLEQWCAPVTLNPRTSG